MISAASSTFEALVQTVSNSYGNNKLPSIVRIEPMNNATQVFKKNEPENLEGMQEEWAQELGLIRHQLLLKTGPQLKKFSKKKLQRTSVEVNSAALTAQQKAEEDSSRVWKLAAQIQKTSYF